MNSEFYNLLYRLRYVSRWSSTKCIDLEDVAQHSYNVTLITHILCQIKINIFHEKIDAEKAIICSLYHDSTDSVLTHIISPVINSSKDMKKSYEDLKLQTEKHMINLLPDELKYSFKSILKKDFAYDIIEIVKIADTIEGVCKCKRELAYKNLEFLYPLKNMEAKLLNYKKKYKFVEYFVYTFLKPFDLINDECRYLKNRGK